MTEEYWAAYKKKKDLTQSNMIWKNVLYSNAYIRFHIDS